MSEHLADEGPDKLQLHSVQVHACASFLKAPRKAQLRLTSGHIRSTEMLQGPEAQAQVFVSLVTSRYRHRVMAPLSTFDVVTRTQL